MLNSKHRQFYIFATGHAWRVIYCGIYKTMKYLEAFYDALCRSTHCTVFFVERFVEMIAAISHTPVDMWVEDCSARVIEMRNLEEEHDPVPGSLK